MKRKKGYYSISAVARMFSVHQQTIRLYEKEGLISPKRSQGNTRMFSEQDVDRLEEIIYLTHKMGVNLAGVEMILKLQKKMSRLKEQMNTLFEQTQGALAEESEAYKKEIKEQVKSLALIKQKTTPAPIEVKAELQEKSKKSRKGDAKAAHAERQASILPSDHATLEKDYDDDWEVEYED